MSTASPGLSSLLPAGSILPAGEHHQVPTGDGGQFHAVVAGTGRPLVLTHGALLSLEVWALLWQQRGHLDPQGFQDGGWQGRHETSR